MGQFLGSQEQGKVQDQNKCQLKSSGEWNELIFPPHGYRFDPDEWRQLNVSWSKPICIHEFFALMEGGNSHSDYTHYSQQVSAQPELNAARNWANKHRDRYLKDLAFRK